MANASYCLVQQQMTLLCGHWVGKGAVCSGGGQEEFGRKAGRFMVRLACKSGGRQQGIIRSVMYGAERGRDELW